MEDFTIWENTDEMDDVMMEDNPEDAFVDKAEILEPGDLRKKLETLKDGESIIVRFNHE